ncbi:MAG: 3-deoxy-8-phosphooctulonate synthase [Planctomycetes bacterium]|nr:3-deoxy-8-phosphooctulonate synthase [Planctomycetota bacterium]
MKPFDVAGVTVGEPGRLFLIAGPCVVEDPARTVRIGRRARDICRDLGVPYIFKASYDKANRSSAKGARGPGVEQGLDVLRRVKEELDVPILTDVHLPEQCAVAAEVADVLQIPAFLCRQTDLVLAAAATGRVVNIKKGQFLAPWDARHPLEKARQGGATRVMLTERGASFGYGNLVSDMRSLVIMRRLGVPVVFDATHSVQLPGARGESTAGEREFIPYLARAAVATGVDGLFAEVHEDPASSPSDAETILPLDDLPGLLETLLKIKALVP